MRTILVTAFGPFPGAPHNPTPAVVRRLAATRRTNLRIVGHVFDTTYAAVDRELPLLLKKHKPDALLMFGLHGRAKTLRVEMLARNVLGRIRDAGGTVPRARTIVRGGDHRRMFSPAPRLVRAARRCGVATVTSRDAGKYLCNYLSWRATESAGKSPQLAAFIHVPPVIRKSLRKGSHGLTSAALQRAAGAILAELAACLGSGRMRT
jgi:pyroglutamyl-peptidase